MPRKTVDIDRRIGQALQPVLERVQRLEAEVSRCSEVLALWVSNVEELFRLVDELKERGE